MKTAFKFYLPRRPKRQCALLRLLVKKRGAVLVEAALAFLVLVPLFLYTVEFSSAFIAKRKVAAVTAAIADILSQSSCVTESEAEAAIAAVSPMMAPYDKAKLSVAVSQATSGTPVCLIGACTELNLPEVTSPSIIVTATYRFKPVLGLMLTSGKAFSSQSVVRPRSGLGSAALPPKL